MNTAAKKSVAKTAHTKEAAPKEGGGLEFMPMEMAHGFMQLKPCACGGGCPRCTGNKNNNRRMLQTKLQIGAAHDIYEQEADRVADEVLATPKHKVIDNNVPPRIQRLTNQTNTQTNAAPPSVDRALSESGSSLEPVLQQDMEQRFGQDFSQVRVHTGTVAEQSAQDVSAHAYTVGNNIVFGAGQFAPNSQQGKRLLAHELTHVVQQSGNRDLGIQRYIVADVLEVQLTDEQAQMMTDAELAREIERLRDYINTHEETSPEVAGAAENLRTLEDTLVSRNPLPAPRRSRSRERTEWVTRVSEYEIAEAGPSPESALHSDPAIGEAASRMTPDELDAEITRLRAEMTAAPADSIENEVNEARLAIFEREVEERDRLMLAHARGLVGLDDVVGGYAPHLAFLSAFVTEAGRQVPPGERDAFERDIRDHPMEFLDGVDEGLGRGFMDGINGIVDAITSTVEFAGGALVFLVEHGDELAQLRDDAIHELAYRVLGERRYTRLVDEGMIVDTGFLERRRDYERRVDLVRDFGEELARDPSIVINWSSDLGRALGDSVGRSITEVLRRSPREKGVFVGRIIGQILFEIILQLALAVATDGVGNAVRAGAGALRGIEVSAELANLLRRMAEGSAAVRRLLRIIETGEDVVGTAADVARVVERAPDLPPGSAGVLDTILEESGIAGRADLPDIPERAGTHGPEGSTPREPSIDTETPRAEGARTAEPDGDVPAESASDTDGPSSDSAPEPERTRTAEPESDTPEVSGDTEAPSADSAPPPAETRPTTARERIEARRRAAADTRAEMEETLRLSRADSSVLTEQLEEIDRRLRIARRREASEVELLEDQREEIISQMQELIDERRLIGEDWLEASRAGAEASQEYFINITNRARRYYPDGLEAVFGSGTSVEHIVPRSRMFGMEGFERLTADQQVSLFAWEPNLRLVPAEFNSARGATPYARLSRDIWGRFTTDESIISRLAGAETTLESQILNMIRNPSTIPPLTR